MLITHGVGQMNFSVNELDRATEVLAKKLINDLKLRDGGVKRMKFAVIGYKSKRSTKGGVLVIGYNGHLDKSDKRERGGIDWESYSDAEEERKEIGFDELLDEHPYFKLFTQDFGLKKHLNENIKFTDLVPIRTPQKKEIVEKFRGEFKGFQEECFDHLKVLIKEIEPELILCNDADVSKLFLNKTSNQSKGGKYITSCKFGNIPVILSGQQRTDNFSRGRLRREIMKTLENGRMRQ